MADNHIIVAGYAAGGYTKTRPAFQYDYGQELQLQGFPELPASFEMHFSIGMGQAITRIGTNGAVAVPNACLERFGTLTAWLFLHDAETDGETKYVIEIPVRSRAKTTDQEPTPEEQSVITEAIAALSAGVTAAEAAQAAAEAAAESVGEAAEQAQGKAGEAAASATAAAGSAASADGAARAAGSAATAANGSATAAAGSAATASGSAEAAAGSATAAAESAAAAAQTVAGIEEAGAAQVLAVNTAGAAKVDAINTAGTEKVNAVNTAGAAQVQAVEAKGEEVIEEIPADYSALSADVTNLKGALKAVEDSTVVVVASNFKRGIATASMTPVASDNYKYVILEKSKFDGDLYVASSTAYNILYKRSQFSEDRTLIYTDVNWIPIESRKGKLDNSLRETTFYVGLTICYSSTEDTTGIVSNIPVDDLFVIRSPLTLETVYSDLVDQGLDLKYFKQDTEHSIGGYNFGRFIYGEANGSITPYNLTTKKFKCIVVDISTLDKDLYIFNKTVYNVLCGITISNSDGETLIQGGYTKLDDGSICVRKSYSAFPTAKYVSVTYALSINTVISGAVNTIEDDNKVWLSKYDKNIETRLSMLENKYTDLYNAIVDVNGDGDYTTINAAINGTNEGDTILIMPGQYNEDVRMWGKDRTLLGLDREKCIIYAGNGLYNTPALEANKGEIKNLTIISGNDDELSEDSTVAKAYGVHIEYENSTPYQIIFDNCTIISELNAAIGIGCRYNQTVIIRNCYLETKASKIYSSYYSQFVDVGGLLFHNDAAASGVTGDGRLIVDNCEIKGKTKAVMVQSMENNIEMTVRFNKCLAYIVNNGTSDVVGYWGHASKGAKPYFCGTDVKLDSLSYGNNSPELDYLNYWNA